MARKPAPKTAAHTISTELMISRDEAKRRLIDRIEKGQQFTQIEINSTQSLEAAKHEFHKWNAFNAELLKQIFTTDELSEEYSW